jgi:hypothetical protein
LLAPIPKRDPYEGAKVEGPFGLHRQRLPGEGFLKQEAAPHYQQIRRITDQELKGGNNEIKKAEPPILHWLSISHSQRVQISHCSPADTASQVLPVAT